MLRSSLKTSTHVLSCMAILLKVQWVDKTGEAGPCQCVLNIGGSTRQLHWKHSQADAIRGIEQGEFAYYIETSKGMSSLGVGVRPDGQKYLKTRADREEPSHLVNLPPFPILPTVAASHRAQNLLAG